MTAVLALILVAQAPKYSGPVPAKSDLPCLLHADKLVELEPGTAQEEKKKDDTLYTVPGAGATQARTPMAEPIFVVKAEKLVPDRMALYKLEVRNGRREVLIPRVPKRNSTRPIRTLATRLSNGLFKIEAQEFLENGEYCLSPDGSNQVFCFSVY
jgi:hypothetical protein